MTGLATVPGVLLVMSAVAAGGSSGVVVVVVGAVVLMAAATVGGALNAMFALVIYRDQVQGAGSLGLSSAQMNSFIKLKDD